MAHTQVIWNWMAKSYSKSTISDQASYERKLHETKELLPEGAEVFEFGCGTGSTALWHAPHVARYVATDGSSNMIEIARDKAEAAGVDHVSFAQCAIEDYKVQDQFDAVLAMSILHLLRNRKAALDKAFALLKPGGRLFASTICMGDSGLGMRILATVIRWAPIMPYVQSFTEERHLAEIRAAGFEIERHWRPDPKAATFVIARKP